MKKLYLYLIHGLFLVCFLIGGAFLFYSAQQQPISQSRITNILDGNNDQLKSVAMQNTTTVNGAVTIQVDTLQQSVQFENYSGHLRWSTADSRLEYSNDDTVSWITMIDWTVTGTDDIHDDRIASSSVTQHQGDIDHGSIAGIADDDHTQYALLAGRDGGQTLIGGINDGNDLTLQSTSGSTKGSIFLGVAGTSVYDEVNDFLGVGVADPDTEIETDGEIKQRIVSSNVSNPPTDAELDALFTSPATKGDGWTVYIDDDDSENFYQVVASGALWFIFTAAKAL